MGLYRHETFTVQYGCINITNEITDQNGGGIEET